MSHCVGKVTSKLISIRSRWSISMGLTKEQCMPIKVRKVAEIEINDVCLTLSVKWGSKNFGDRQEDWSW